MKIIKSFKVLKQEINFSQNIGFVPTMGSLHKGHLSLINIAKKKSKRVLVSIFVNPSQFNDKKDYQNYPRELENDILKLKKYSVDYLFLPTESEIYQKKINKKINISNNDKILCAKHRKGHFEGVLAVVNRLLQNINSKYVFFGEKDYQQIFLIKKYLKKFKNKIIICNTVRNKNFLPLSSRNKLLSKISLLKAEKISQLILNFKKKILTNFSNINLLNHYKTIIREHCDNIEYLEVRNKNNLSLSVKKNNFKIFIAYNINKIRLIDNV